MMSQLFGGRGNLNTFQVLSLLLLSAALYSQSPLHGQTNSKMTGKHVFYLHGMIVQQQGPEAVSPLYGKYEYYAIVDTLKRTGYRVFSEVRPKDTQIKDYGAKIAAQIRELLDSGVPAEDITVIGASMGAYMALEASVLVRNTEVRYVILGLCGDYGLKYFMPVAGNIYGTILSIYEKSDDMGTCQSLFSEENPHVSFREIALDMGNGHGFLFKPYSEWVGPVREWIGH